MEGNKKLSRNSLFMNTNKAIGAFLIIIGIGLFTSPNNPNKDLGFGVTVVGLLILASSK